MKNPSKLVCAVLLTWCGLAHAHYLGRHRTTESVEIQAAPEAVLGLAKTSVKAQASSRPFAGVIAIATFTPWPWKAHKGRQDGGAPSK